MNTKQFARIGLFVGLLALSATGRADDIDIYSGLGATTNIPNIMVVVDNPSSQNNYVGPCTYWDGTPPSQGSKALGADQCALANIVHSMGTKADGSALFRLGLTTMDGVMLPLTPIDDHTYTGPASVSRGNISYSMPTDHPATNREAIIIAVMSLSQTTGLSGQGAELQETWSYYTGGNGSYSGIDTSVGLLSGISYSGTSATSGCQKNYIIYLSNVKAGASHAQDDHELPVLDAAANNAKTSNVISATQFTALDPSATGYTGAIPNKPQQGWGIEWARFMNYLDINTGSAGVQAIVTYSIATGDTAVPITNSMEQYIQDVGVYGGGKYFPAGNNPGELQNDILKIINEVQAVNSVFSSSSLPVSVNAQGTFLNQIYMGMFRPDPGAMPRWAGNLKQYQFVLDPTTNTLSLGDSIGNGAISTAGTGFITPNAISFWTCTNLTAPYINSYLTATPANLTAAQIALLGRNNQNCTEPANGFWVNDPSSANAVPLGFDLPDGERVERGGAAQQIRHTTLTADYTTAPGTSTNPRKLYTWCPGGGTCSNLLTNSANVFDWTNTSLVATAFGASTSANIYTLTRTGGTVYVTTQGNHGFSSGDSITIANANPNEYNGTFSITVQDSTHFQYPITEYPPTPASGSYTVSLPGATQAVSTLSRTGNSVTVTTPVPHGLAAGTSVIIAGATPNDYNGSFVIDAVPPPTTTTFNFTLNERPATVAGGGTASTITKATGSGCPCSSTISINAWNDPAPGIQRTLGSTTVTVNTPYALTIGSNTFKVGNSVTLSGVTDSSGNTVAEYNGSFTIVSVSGNSFTFTTTLSPSTPATGTITASTSTPLTITGLTHAGTTAAAQTSADLVVAGFTNNATATIGGTPGPNETAYLGSYTITLIDANHFTYPITTTPISPATGVGGVTMTATRNTGLDAAHLADFLKWVRGMDNEGDEKGPGGTVTIRPSVHGDVLHSRPTVINYGSYTVNITATSDTGTTRTATASATDVNNISISGATPVVTFANGQACPVTVASSTTFTYQTTSCGAAGAQTASVGAKIVVFYGDNGGVFHAVNGNQTAAFGATVRGDEMWGFIPKEFFSKLVRLRNNSPQLNLPSTPPGISPQPRIKDYFVDGSTGIYQVIDGSGTTTKAVLYLAMRRGGNFIYALDVTDPTVPKVLWKVDNTGVTNSTGTFTADTAYSELGQTWSQPKVAKVKGYCGGTACSSTNPQTPVLIFGGGYDVHEDDEPPSVNTSGRAIYVLDALTGAVVWKAAHSGGGTSYSGTTLKASALISGMDYGIPSDITLLDRNRDGFIDRLYAADVGGNIWRVDLEPSGNATPDNWRVYRLAALGCWTGSCGLPTTTTQRKFFYPPEVITATSTYNYDSVIAGTGDREHPLAISATTQRNNRLVLLKDTYTGNDASGMTPITFGGTLSLFDATSTPWDGSLNGYYITLAPSEKVVNAPLVTAGYVYMGTNQPPAASSTSCIGLGIATGYRLAPFAGTVKTVVFSGGGLPPSPVSGVVNIVVGGVVKQMPFLIGGGNPDCVGTDCKSALGGQKPPINVSTKRRRTYWYIENK